MAKWADDVTWVAEVGAALSDSGRVRLLVALGRERLCVCQLTELLGLAPSTVSKHLSILKQSGLVREDKSGRWVFHALAADSPELAGLLAWLKSRLARDPRLQADRAKLKAILKMNTEELCRRQNAR